MSSKPTLSIGRLRKAVREVCNLAPGYPKTEELFADSIRELLRVSVEIGELRAAVEWNHAEGYIRMEKNTETEEVEWIITDHGIAKERIK